jgi:hypothetical protein
MYKAEIIGKEFVRGMLSIAVRFRDEEANDEVKEIFQNNQQQTEDWITEQIDRKLKHLNGLKELSTKIDIGTEFEAKAEAEKADEAKIAQTEFIDDVNKLRSMKRFIDIGIIEENDESYVALQTKIKNNFKSEYIGLV